ncbi:MAG: hypothetical protein HKN33_03570 [Pyrinomonadaceae bacterium]|nr:hypothetical protein [Pyrinomonadaceae bacterium]
MSEVAFCETISINVDKLKYEAVEQSNGNATIIKFDLDTERYNPGDVLVVLDEDNIVFHGIIGGFEDGRGIASDPKGSLLPATVQ